jgi:hypothetical protein
MHDQIGAERSDDEEDDDDEDDDDDDAGIQHSAVQFKEEADGWWEHSTWCCEASHLVGRLHARPKLDEPLDCILVPIVGCPVECGRLQHLGVVVVDICSVRDEAAGDKWSALDQGKPIRENGEKANPTGVRIIH